jgi:acyl-CoA dehydrogenase
MRKIAMIGGRTTYELAFDDCWVPESKLLGQEGNGYGPMQLRLSTRRVQIGAICAGRAKRALDMMVEYVPQRKTFGVPLSDRQAIQWWIADAATKIHATRLMTYDAAEKVSRGEEARTECSMLKIFATEMATEIIDHAQQSFGAMGMTREMPFHLMAAQIRVMRIYEGRRKSIACSLHATCCRGGSDGAAGNPGTMSMKGARRNCSLRILLWGSVIASRWPCC